MGSSFAIGLAGLSTNGRGLEVVGNNLANLNTIGFKSSNITFSEVLGKLGSQVAGIHERFSQGGVETSTNPLDIAIQGRGFFEILLPDGTQAYTRDGTFQINSDGALVTSGGRILGVQALGADIGAAIARAYEGVACIRFDGMQCRRDIGQKALGHQRVVGRP